MRIAYANCQDEEECKFFIPFFFEDKIFFFCKEHRVAINAPKDSNPKCSICNKSLEAYEMYEEDNLCPICEKDMLNVVWVSN